MDEEWEFLANNKGLLYTTVKRMRRLYPSYRRIDYPDLLQVGRIGMLLAFREYDPRKGMKLSSYATDRISWEIGQVYGKKYQRDPVFRAYPFRDAVDPHDLQDEFEVRDEKDFTACRLQRALKELHSRSVEILCLRYGLGGKEPALLSEIGETYGVSKERIRQILYESQGKLFLSREFAPERRLVYADQAAATPVLPTALLKLIASRAAAMLEDTTIRIRGDDY